MIKQYLYFAIDNWYRIDYETYNLHQTITSKDFIKAVAKWVIKKVELWAYEKGMIICWPEEEYWLDALYYIDNKKWLENEICKLQALMIKDWKLISFIDKLINHG